MRPWTNRSSLLASLGLTLTLVGAAIYLLRNVIYHGIINHAFSLTPSSRGFELWSNTSKIPTYLDIYFFNWTNPEDINNKTTKPNLVQVGPYSFREWREKVNIVFHPENGTVSYRQKRTWFFDQSRSNGTLKDKISHLNVVAVTAAHKIRYWPFVMQQSLSYMLNQFSNKVNIIKTVDELLFKGFNDEIINLGKLAGMADEAPPFDKFGWFYERNGSTEFDGHSNMATGIDGIANLGKLKMWNYKEATDYYQTPCNAVEGSAGEFWPPYQTKEDIQYFSADICRPVTFEYQRDVNHKGIKGYKYTMGRRTLSNNTRRSYSPEQFEHINPTTTTTEKSYFTSWYSTTPTTTTTTTERPTGDDGPVVINEGQCFCNGECSPMGVLNITACRYGAPGFVSLPHFLNGDPVLTDSVQGLNPQHENHSFYLTLEPTTGIPIDIAARLQINIMMRPSKSVVLFKDVPTIYFPILWFEMKAGIPDDMVGEFQFFLKLPIYLGYFGLIMMFIGSCILLSVAILCYVDNQRGLPQLTSKKMKALQKKTEILYMDKSCVNEDSQTRNDRRLYAKA